MEMTLPGAMAPAQGFTAQQLAEFERTGYAGPFDSGLDGAQVDAMRAILMDFLENDGEHPLYGRFAVRDWHLVYPQLLDLIRTPTLVSQLQQLMGPDLTMWRSKVFHKPPGDGAIEWHQEWGAFNGEEIGNDKPSLQPAEHRRDAYWNTTVWFAMEDIPVEKGAMQFVSGSYHTRYPIDMIPMVDSAFWSDPFLGIHDKPALIDKCRRSLLVLDMDTAHLLDHVDLDASSFDELKQIILRYFSEVRAAITLPFDIAAQDLVTIPCKKGQYIIFPERTMHRSVANTSGEHRVALNFRVTPSDTLVYPGRLRGDPVDGSNLDITDHRCTLLSGKNLNPLNVY